MIRSPMKKKRLLWYWELQLSLQYGGCSSNYLLLVFVMKYVYIKTLTPVMRAHKFWDNQPITSLALFKIHEIIEPMIPGSDANALSASLPNSCDRAFNLFFIHSLAPPLTFSCLSLVVVLCNVGVDVVLGPPNRASIRTPRVIPRAVKIETLLYPVP